MKCALLLWSHLSLLLVLILVSADLTASTSSCPSHCGNISIPYPFGIGKGCYLNEWFAIQCNNFTSGELVPYLPKINKEVVKILLPDPEYSGERSIYGSLGIKTNITSMGCSNNSDQLKFGDPLNFTGTTRPPWHILSPDWWDASRLVIQKRWIMISAAVVTNAAKQTHLVGLDR